MVFRGKLPGRFARAGLAALAAAAAACENAGVGSAPFLPAAPTAAPTRPSAGATPPPIALPDVPAAAARFESLRRGIAADLAAPPPPAAYDAPLARLENRSRRLLERPGLSAEEGVQLVDLQDLESELRSLDEDAARLEAELTERARTLDADLSNLSAERARWNATLPELAAGEAPEAFRARAAAIAASIDGDALAVKARRDEILTRLDRASQARSATAAARLEAANRHREAQRRLFAIAEAPIWELASAHRPMAHFAAERLARDGRRFRRWAADRGARTLGSFGVFFAAALVLLLLLRGPAREAANADPFARAAEPVLRRPLAGAMLASLLALIGFVPRPSAPLLVWDVVWMLAILSTAVLLAQLLKPSLRRTLAVVTLAACLYPLRYLYEQDPLLDRLVLIAQAIAVGGTLSGDLVARRWSSVLPGRRWQRLATGVAGASVLLLAAALVLVVVGYVAPAHLLRTGVIGSLGFALITLGGYSLLYGVASALLATPPARASHVLQNRAAAVRGFLRKGLAVLAVFEWAVWSLAAFGVLDTVSRAVGQLLGSTLAIGSARLSVSGILTFAIVLGAAFLLASVVRFLLEGELLPRLRLARGLPFTISTTVRYLILGAGVLLAFSAAGVDLSRMTLLAGALGVGIGFGLQNLVSNFAAGLILLFERPIQVGDVVDVGALLGEVTRIGMRSSTVRTADGAEVIVPNSDLISKSFVNWTLSDRRRRLEVKVGVAYGADPERVIALLLQAARDHPEALGEPAPAAYFAGFGDSALDFVLQVWVARVEQALPLQSAVRRAVHRLLAENGIEIPFPQRDLNLRSVSPEAAGTLRGEAPAAGAPAALDDRGGPRRV